MIAALLLFSTLAIPIPRAAVAAEVKASWQEEWEKTLKAAEQEGQVVLYSLSEIGEAIANTGFQKKFPKIKVEYNGASGRDQRGSSTSMRTMRRPI